MMISLEVKGLGEQLRRIGDLPKQVRFAASNALNDVAFAASKAVAQEMPKAFDRPTPFVVESISVEKASPQNLTASILPLRRRANDVEPANVLRAEVLSGSRRLKRSESAFQRSGILPAGFYMVPSRELMASDKVDAYGNVKGSFIVQLLSYFQAFGEQGYRANMSQKRRDRLKKSTRRSLYGVEYFVSHGDAGARGSRAAQQQKPGIYARRSTGFGDAIYPVFRFVRQPKYSARLDMASIVMREARRVLPSAMSRRLSQALSTAR